MYCSNEEELNVLAINSIEGKRAQLIWLLSGSRALHFEFLEGGEHLQNGRS